MIDLGRLAAQGRAYSGSRPWEVEELDALLLLERERGISRTSAADHVRNGIMTLEAFDKATKAAFKPKTLEEAQEAAEDALKDNAFATGDEAKVASPKVKKGKK